MKKLLLSLLATVYSLTSNAQQTLQRVKQENNQTIVELFQIRNGNNRNNVIGPNGYDQGMSQGSGGEVIYLESTGIAYPPNAYGTIPLGNFPAEQIGNGTFEIATTPYHNNKADTVYHFNDNGTPMPGGEFTVKRYHTDRDAIEDGNTNADMLHSKWILPHTFDNGNPLPVGMHMILMSRDGWKLPEGGTHASKRIGFRWNGNAWIQQVNDPNGDPYDNLEQATLAVDSTANKSSHLLYPNPVKDILHFSEEVSNIKITDVAGRTVKEISANSKSINISHLAKGNYIVTSVAKSGEVVSRKIVKE